MQISSLNVFVEKFESTTQKVFREEPNKIIYSSQQNKEQKRSAEASINCQDSLSEMPLY